MIVFAKCIIALCLAPGHHTNPARETSGTGQSPLPLVVYQRLIC
jgi:hypothetical protein